MNVLTLYCLELKKILKLKIKKLESQNIMKLILKESLILFITNLMKPTQKKLKIGANNTLIIKTVLNVMAKD